MANHETDTSSSCLGDFLDDGLDQTASKGIVGLLYVFVILTLSAYHVRVVVREWQKKAEQALQ